MSKTIIEKLDELISTAEKWVIVDSEGKEHDLSEGVMGTAKKVDPKQEIYELLGVNPKYITFDSLISLDTTFKTLLEMVYFDASYSVKKKFEKYAETGEIEVIERKKRGPNKKKDKAE